MNLEKPLAENCQRCGDPLSYLWKLKGRRVCAACHKKRKEETPVDPFTREIRGFYKETIGELKNCVSHSRKGKPHKQAWGFHIEH